MVMATKYCCNAYLLVYFISQFKLVLRTAKVVFKWVGEMPLFGLMCMGKMGIGKLHFCQEKYMEMIDILLRLNASIIPRNVSYMKQSGSEMSYIYS